MGDGEVTIFGPPGIKHDKVNPALNQIHARWLTDDVIKTLDVDDVKRGSLGKWHKLSQWEVELTARIQVSSHRMSLDVSNGFEPYSWIEGLLSTNLQGIFISDLHLVDTDWHILRIAFFSNIAWEFAVHFLGKDDTNCAGMGEDKERKLKYGKKVIVHSLDAEDDSLVVADGMQGKILEQKDESHYLVAFTNLTEPNLRRAAKTVSREYILCKCGKESEFVCN